ncbi:hypothetical protein AG1IA_02139 [Rhizoctonia solani AG-1 IA]|uniref:Uncharacterized protein n=1 Tax=Thanatephorus cucumeris (strain AG1-IA) TaxID=983506 RepID=L8X3Z9_THACA|nr:hypothetical protein AG1IA_02139 [Rhizoctonia solani AG-1 IA]
MYGFVTSEVDPYAFWNRALSRIADPNVSPTPALDSRPALDVQSYKEQGFKERVRTGGDIKGGTGIGDSIN